MKNILIVEDDASISNLIKMTLVREGYNCECAMDGEQGERAFVQGSFDLVLLDLMLPKISGYDLLEYFHNEGTPVIIISAMGQVGDRIRGLRMGADDYLPKPFQVGELVARVETVLRRTSKVEENISVENVCVNLESRTVTLDGELVDLTVKEFDLLVLLLKHKNVALDRSFLYENVWHEDYIGETRTLDNHIQRIRKKLNWNDKIQTVFRIGYRLKL